MSRCPQCSAENPEDSYFCGSCGQQLRSAIERATGPVNIGDELGSGSAAPAEPGADSSPNRLNIAAPPARLSSDTIQPGPVDPSGASDYSIGPGQGFGASTAPPAEQAPYVPPPGYAPPPSQVAPVPAGYNPYAQFQPADGNTSGMGSGYQAPAQASGWTFAGFVPWGLFSFFNGNTTWGAIGLGLWLLGPYLVYSIYIGIKGKELAWQERRFESIEQYEAVMKSWNTAGIVILLLGLGFVFLYFMVIFGVIFAGMSGNLN